MMIKLDCKEKYLFDNDGSFVSQTAAELSLPLVYIYIQHNSLVTYSELLQ